MGKIKKTVQRSGYLRANVCSQCDWFEPPNAPFHKDICPLCGSDIEEAVGKFDYTEERGWLQSIPTTTYLNFIRRDADAFDWKLVVQCLTDAQGMLDDVYQNRDTNIVPDKYHQERRNVCAEARDRLKMGDFPYKSRRFMAF